jgi:excinuclease UvrABC ATPase subunit
MGHAADGHDRIEVRGARENNLADVSLDIPKRRLTVFTGVSGSGKSSLVFGTIAAESQRLINETYPAFLQSFMAAPSRPDVEGPRNLSTAIVVDQERMGANSRSTVGTATDAHTMPRIVFSRFGELDRLVDNGNTVIVIEHHQAVTAHADGSSTWAPAPGTTAAGWCSRAPGQPGGDRRLTDGTTPAEVPELVPVRAGRVEGGDDLVGRRG